MITHVMWFRKDLRLEDNTAFYHALESLQKNDRLLCLFHLDQKQYKIGEPSHDYFFSALEEFRKELAKNKIALHLLTGDLVEAFSSLKTQFPDFKHLYFNLDNSGFGQKRDLSITHLLESEHISVHAFEESHLHKAKEILKNDGTPYQKFTPYYKKWAALPKPAYRYLDVSSFSPYTAHLPELTKDGDRELNYLLSNRKKEFSNEVGETQATDRLNDFVANKLESYHLKRDFPFKDGTSHISSFLSTGQISIRKVWHIVMDGESHQGQEIYLKELAWRDFYQMIYHYHPNQYKEEFNEKYRSLNWKNNPEFFDAWKNGQTGFPIIDAAMRQLNETGWMHNRLRMLVASFLTKDLLIDWRLGERYFAEKLIDYDAASNIGGWQWAASTGTDAVPYFRIFNPTTQSLKFDKEGGFIKSYVPELAKLPSKLIHEPHSLSKEQQAELNFYLGQDYPFPIVNHTIARKETLEWFQSQ